MALLLLFLDVAYYHKWINLEYSQLGDTEFRKIDMKSTSVCGYTYHCGLTESALCPRIAQM